MNDKLRVTSNPLYRGRLVPIETESDVPERWRGSPIETLILANNFEKPIETTGDPHLLLITCIEFRYQPKLPASFAYVIRRAGGRLIGSEFSLAYAMAKGVRHIALVGHNDCGMTKVAENRQPMVDALVEQGWYKDRAEDFVDMHASRYAITDELDSLKREYLRLRRLFHKIEIAPLFVSLANGKMYMPGWYLQMLVAGELDKPVGDPTLVPDEELLTL